MKLTQIKETYEQEMHTCGPEDIGTYHQGVPATLMVRTESPDGFGSYVVINVTEWSFGDDAEIDAFAAKIKEVLVKGNAPHKTPPNPRETA
jgi:hypothetical protein